MTAKQEKALAALIRSPTIEAAAGAVGVGYTTLRRWLKEDAAFQQEYRAALANLTEDAIAQAKQNLSPALSVLREITESADQPGAVRVQAARSLLEYGLKFTERADILDRMDKLEKMIAEVEGK